MNTEQVIDIIDANVSLPTLATVALTGDYNDLINLPAGGAASGTYTPTITNVTNVVGITQKVCTYMHIGNVVTITGRFEMGNTATTQSEVTLTLPVNSNFGSNANEGTGFGTSNNPSAASGLYMVSQASNNKARCIWSGTAGQFGTVSFTFMYQVI